VAKEERLNELALFHLVKRKQRKKGDNDIKICISLLQKEGARLSPETERGRAKRNQRALQQRRFKLHVREKNLVTRFLKV